MVPPAPVAGVGGGERGVYDLDGMIQRLFGVGVALNGALAFASQPEAADRISQAIGYLDDTIKELRLEAFGMHHRGDRMP